MMRDAAVAAVGAQRQRLDFALGYTKQGQIDPAFGSESVSTTRSSPARTRRRLLWRPGYELAAAPAWRATDHVKRVMLSRGARPLGRRPRLTSSTGGRARRASS